MCRRSRVGGIVRTIDGAPSAGPDRQPGAVCGRTASGTAERMSPADDPADVPQSEPQQDGRADGLDTGRHDLVEPEGVTGGPADERAGRPSGALAAGGTTPAVPERDAPPLERLVGPPTQAGDEPGQELAAGEG